MKQVKKEVKSKNFYLTIYTLIKQGKSPKDICLDLQISKQKLQYYLDYLKNNNYIKKIGYGTWEVKKEVKQILIRGEAEKPSINLHSLNINFPILKGKIQDEDWVIINKLNNWLPKYKNLDILGGLTARNNNNKSLTIMAKSRNIKNLEELDELARKIQTYVFEYFRKEGVILDILGCKVTNLNIATEDKEAEGMVRKGEKFELDLNKKAEKIFPKDNINGKAWIDGSPFKFSAETNDKEWKRLYLTMPFNVHNVYNLFSEMAQNISLFARESAAFGNYLKLHDDVFRELKGMVKEIRRDIKQKKLNDYF